MFPRIEIDVEKIRENTRTIVRLCSQKYINVCGVTKAVCGDPIIARAMIQGGVKQLADSRISNIKRMREAGIESEMILLRSPGPSIVDDVVEYADISLVSEIHILGMLNTSASIRDTDHGVILMVDFGDRREGVLPEEIQELVEIAHRLDHITLRGIGTNFACYCGVIPTEEKMEEFCSLINDVEVRIRHPIGIISGGNSANIPLVLNGSSLGCVNHLRIGEGILLGLETVNRSPIPGTHQDSFRILAELVESKIKPSMPDGTIGQDAFGSVPEFNDRGSIHEGLLALGRQDIEAGSLTPMDPNIEILGANSDYVITDLGVRMNSIGETLGFIPGYGSLLRAMSSPYVTKNHLGR